MGNRVERGRCRSVPNKFDIADFSLVAICQAKPLTTAIRFASVRFRAEFLTDASREAGHEGEMRPASRFIKLGFYGLTFDVVQGRVIHAGCLWE